MASWNHAGTETVDAVSVQQTTAHAQMIIANGVPTSEVVAMDRHAQKERSATPIENVVLARSAAASETAAVDATANEKVTDQAANPENLAKVEDVSVPHETKLALQDVKIVEAAVEELQMMAASEDAIHKTRARDMEMRSVDVRRRIS
jgi:ribosomal protein L5